MELFKDSEQYPTLEIKCPECAANLNAVTATSGIGGPEEGDFSVCAYCGMILRFDQRLRLRPAKPEEMDEMLLHQPEEYALLKRAQEGARQLNRQRQKQA